MAAATGQRYSAIFMDVEMPKMDGVQATQIIKKHSPSTVIIIMTANADPATLAQCRRSGADHVLAKPVRFSVVEELIQKVIMYALEWLRLCAVPSVGGGVGGPCVMKAAKPSALLVLFAFHGSPPALPMCARLLDRESADGSYQPTDGGYQPTSGANHQPLV